MEKTADEMFNELGYEKYENETEIIYRQKEIVNDERFFWRITFAKIPKICGANHLISMQELQAINKKCQELGWLDE